MVQLAPGSEATDEALPSHRDRARSRGYKVPKAIVRVDQVQRTPTGKPDYPWAKSVAGGG